MDGKNVLRLGSFVALMSCVSASGCTALVTSTPLAAVDFAQAELCQGDVGAHPEGFVIAGLQDLDRIEPALGSRCKDSLRGWVEDNDFAQHRLYLRWAYGGTPSLRQERDELVIVVPRDCGHGENAPEELSVYRIPAAPQRVRQVVEGECPDQDLPM